MYIERAIERELAERFSTSKALAVTGARQVGKTTVTRHLYPEIRRINMKDSRLHSAAEEDPHSFWKALGVRFSLTKYRQLRFC